MITRLLRWVPGWVRVETEGGYPERLLNDLAVTGIDVWGVRRAEECMRFSCRAGDYRRICPLARHACLRMRMRQKHGFPFWRHRYRYRKGLLLGLVVYIVLLLALSPRIWVIEVEGNVATSKEAVLEQAQRYGVKLGGRMDALQIKQFQLHGTDALETVGYITVNPSHCVARIQVTERTPTPQVIDLSRPSDIVAARDGRILQIESRSGQKMVKVGEAVTAGTVLISGRVLTDLGEKLYRAYGEVLAETTRRITVSVPLLQTRWVPTDRVVCRPVFSLLCWDFHLYSKKPLQAKTASFTRSHPLIIGGVALPLGLRCSYDVFLAEQHTILTTEQAQELARQQLAEQESALFSPDSYTRLTESGRVQGDTYVLTATYRCRENIALEVPIAGTG